MCVSIVIPCFNASATLASAITSALRGDDVQAELIVVDDGSTDRSLEVARAFGSSVRVLTGPNRGVSAARNRGIAATTRDWIVFLDADDLLVPGSLRRRLEAADTMQADVVVSWWQDIIQEGEINSDGAVRSVDMGALNADAEIACATHVWATTAALMFRRGLVERIGGFREDLPIIQDARFLFDAAYLGARFVESPHIGARYRIRPESLSRRNPDRFWCDVLTNGEQIEALWRARGALSPAHRTALRGIYDNAARGLFAGAHPRYFEAVERQRSLGGPPPLHPRVAAPLARAFGIARARRLLALLGR